MVRLPCTGPIGNPQQISYDQGALDGDNGTYEDCRKCSTVKASRRDVYTIIWRHAIEKGAFFLNCPVSIRLVCKFVQSKQSSVHSNEIHSSPYIADVKKKTRMRMSGSAGQSKIFPVSSWYKSSSSKHSRLKATGNTIKGSNFTISFLCHLFLLRVNSVKRRKLLLEKLFYLWE